MAVGFNTAMRFTGKKEDLDRIFEIGNDGDGDKEGEIYIHDGYSDYTYPEDMNL